MSLAILKQIYLIPIIYHSQKYIIPQCFLTYNLFIVYGFVELISEFKMFNNIYSLPFFSEHAVGHSDTVPQGGGLLILLPAPPPAQVLHPTPHGCDHQQGYHP